MAESEGTVCQITNSDFDHPLPVLLKKVQNHSTVFITELEHLRKIEILSQVLPRCMELTTLILARNRFADAEIKRFAMILTQCTQLEHIVILNNQLSRTALLELIEVLPQLNKLIILFFNGETFSSSVIKKLASVLPECAALERLVLWKTSLTDLATAELTKVLPRCEHLELLDLTDNQITDKGAVEFVKGMSQCSQITNLHLRENRITTVGAKALAEVLPFTHIHTMELNRDKVHLKEQNFIIPALEYNHARWERAQFVLECFYHDMALTRIFSEQDDKIIKRDFIVFKFWAKNNALWTDLIGRNNEKEIKILRKKISDYIDQHYLEITDVVRNMENLSKDNPDSREISLCDLPLHVMYTIFSYVELEDVNNS